MAVAVLVQGHDQVLTGREALHMALVAVGRLSCAGYHDSSTSLASWDGDGMRLAHFGKAEEFALRMGGGVGVRDGNYYSTAKRKAREGLEKYLYLPSLTWDGAEFSSPSEVTPPYTVDVLSYSKVGTVRVYEQPHSGTRKRTTWENRLSI